MGRGGSIEGERERSSDGMGREGESSEDEA